MSNLYSPLKPIALTTASATSSTPTERMSGSTSSYLRRTNAKSFARSREYIVCPSRFKFAAPQTMKGVLFSAETQTVKERRRMATYGKGVMNTKKQDEDKRRLTLSKVALMD